LRLTLSLSRLQTISNIRPIRSMSIQSVFANTFEDSARTAMAGGVKAAPFTAAGFASVNTLTYVTEGASPFLLARARYESAH